MKKFFSKRVMIWGAVVVAGVCALALIIPSVFRTADIRQMALDNIAEARFFMKQGATTSFRVQFSSGVRENPYAQDGRANATVPFALVYLEPIGSSMSAYDTLGGTLRLGDEELAFNMERAQFRPQNFAHDIERLVERGTDVVLILNLTTGNVTIPLQDAMSAEGAIGWEEALDIVVAEMEEEIRALGEFETYVRIITDRNHSAAYWSIQFLNRNAQTVFAVLTNSGEIIGRSNSSPAG